MGENPKQEILVQPEWSTLIFGDGYIGMMRGGIVREENGIKIVEITLEPHANLRKRYDIKDSDLSDNGYVLSYKMKEMDLIPLNLYDDANRTWLYIKNYNHEETNISNIDWDLRKRLEEEQKKRGIQDGEIAWYSEQLLLAKTNPAEFMAPTLEIFEKINSSLMENLSNKGQKDKNE